MKAMPRFSTGPAGVALREPGRMTLGSDLGQIWPGDRDVTLWRCEALGLGADVDLDRGVLRVCQALQQAGGVLRLGPVKSDGSARFVAMPMPCVEAEALPGNKNEEV